MQRTHTDTQQKRKKEREGGATTWIWIATRQADHVLFFCPVSTQVGRNIYELSQKD